MINPSTPDEPDADDALQGLAGYDWRGDRQVRQVS